MYDYCVDDPASRVDLYGLAWVEADHPRDDIGQFTFKNGGSNSASQNDKTLIPSYKFYQTKHPHVETFSAERHKEEKNKASEPFYVFGCRPLDNLDFIYGFSAGYDAEHVQLIDSNVNNFGYFGDVKVKSEDILNKRYIVDYSKKDSKKIIDEARLAVDKELNSEKLGYYTDFGVITDKQDYFLIANNCQTYMDKVFKKANEISKLTGKSLIIN